MFVSWQGRSDAKVVAQPKERRALLSLELSGNTTTSVELTLPE